MTFDISYFLLLESNLRFRFPYEHTGVPSVGFIVYYSKMEVSPSSFFSHGAGRSADGGAPIHAPKRRRKACTPEELSVISGAIKYHHEPHPPHGVGNLRQTKDEIVYTILLVARIVRMRRGFVVLGAWVEGQTYGTSVFCTSYVSSRTTVPVVRMWCL